MAAETPAAATTEFSLPNVCASPPSSFVQPIALRAPGNARVRLAALLSSQDSDSFIGQQLQVCGWSRSVRKQGGGSLCFVVLSDGSTAANLQVVVSSTVPNFSQLLKCGAGCSFRFCGKVVESPAKGQKIELQVSDPDRGDFVEVFGFADGAKYPLAKKEHSREYLREIAHLRPRTQLIGAVARVRSCLAAATHRFFQDRGFLYIHTPIITCADCEGAGEMFSVTTLLPEDSPKREDQSNGSQGGGPSPGETQKKEGRRQLELDFARDFFGRQAYLTVSGQLAVEPFCCSLGDVYTFGPTFRAERSHTSRHLAEFWMVEPEMAFCDLEGNMQVAEEYVKFCVRSCLQNCSPEIDYFEANQEKGLRARLENILSEPFGRYSYSAAVAALQQQEAAGEVVFTEKVRWGMDLGSEHERYLTEKIAKKPVIVFDYPKEIKAFYMKSNPDGKTVRAMDLLVPKVGELVGGSQREESLELLDKMLREKNLNPENYWWYRDLRLFGSIPHSGFGLGFERLVMLVTGLENIRDTIPYPRYPGHAEF
ncbi:asparaginyl-tRNA synthetase, putative [Eimeria brunetti]|uniref:asparagine--tRNA ligase n=1 Tax=Eimeria brunetti TaxID=51314 RepID=U6M1F2_9EIME|nr:asparaginyl-tRNA synthetase, putative [Eimeria brunetti]